MSGVPFFGHAVQAPIVTPPKAVPRVSASQVAPRPIAAATAKANNDPSSRRTVDPIEVTEFRIEAASASQARRRGAASIAADLRAGRLPRRTAAANVPGRSRRRRRLARRPRLGRRSPARRPARGWRRPSAARRAPGRRRRAWSAAIGRGASAGVLAAVGDRRRAPVGGCGAEAGDRLQLDALVGVGHDLVPGHAPAASRRSCGCIGRVVVVAEPDAAARNCR